MILACLLVLAAAAWAVLIGEATTMGAAMGPTMGMGAALWLAVWVAMMVAIMFPTAAPMILAFAQVHGRERARGRPYVPTWIFTSAYLLVWSLAGVVAYAGAIGAEWLASRSMWAMENAGRIGGLILIAAGLYQVSPLKHICLARCRSPLAFILGSWREGRGGAFRMGLEHGGYCLGCCWLLFVILFPLGMLNVAALAAITVLIFAEKTLRHGRLIGRLGAAALIGYGLLVVVAPRVLPTMAM